MLAGAGVVAAALVHNTTAGQPLYNGDDDEVGFHAVYQIPGTLRSLVTSARRPSPPPAHSC